MVKLILWKWNRGCAWSDVGIPGLKQMKTKKFEKAWAWNVCVRVAAGSRGPTTVPHPPLTRHEPFGIFPLSGLSWIKEIRVRTWYITVYFFYFPWGELPESCFKLSLMALQQLWNDFCARICYELSLVHPPALRCVHQRLFVLIPTIRFNSDLSRRLGPLHSLLFLNLFLLLLLSWNFVLCACDHPSLSWVWTHSSGYLFVISESQRQLENVSAHRHDMTGSISHGPPHLYAWAAIQISIYFTRPFLFSPTCLLYCGVYGFLLTWGCWLLGILKAACFGVTVKISLSFAWYIEG